MDFSISVSGCDRSHRKELFKAVEKLLSQRLGDYGPGVQIVTIISTLPSRPPWPHKLISSDYLHQHIDALPLFKYRRNTRRVEIEYRSELFCDQGLCQAVTAELLNDVALDIKQTLPLLADYIVKREVVDFDRPRFLEDASRLLTEGLPTLEAWKEFLPERHIERHRVQRPNEPDWQDLWNRLGIAPANCDPGATLKYPSTWDSPDVEGPFRSVTVPDLLRNYQDWRLRNPAASPLLFLDRLFDKRDLTSEERCDRSIETYFAARRIEASIAMAFALVTMPEERSTVAIEFAVTAVRHIANYVEESDYEESTKELWQRLTARLLEELPKLPT